MTMTVGECIAWLEGTRPECAADADKMVAVIDHLREISLRNPSGETIRSTMGGATGGHDDDRTVAGSHGPLPLAPTDRDALIERVKAIWVDGAFLDGTVRIDLSDLRALISLASTSPAQTENRVMAGLREAVAGEFGRVTVIPSPAQWPEDVVERVAKAIRHKCAEIDQRPGIVFADAMWFSEEYARAAIATLPPPEDERVKGPPREPTTEMIDAAKRAYVTAGPIAFADFWIAMYDSALSSYRGGA